VFTEAQAFYSISSLKSFTRQDVLEGRVIKINPALVTITDGLDDRMPPESLQKRVQHHVEQLLEHNVHTFHVDINFEDYSGFSGKRPNTNTVIFMPSFLKDLNEIVRSHDGFLNLHLLTNFPHLHLCKFDRIELGAVCFQLDVISGSEQLQELVHHILDIGACASPVIETVGSENLMPKPKEEILLLLEPVLPEIGMLTFQAAGTASRSNLPAGTFNKEGVGSYIRHVKESFTGTFQMQGGITTSTIGEAVRMGAEFLVSGTQIFRNQRGLTAPQVIDQMLVEAAEALRV